MGGGKATDLDAAAVPVPVQLVRTPLFRSKQAVKSETSRARRPQAQGSPANRGTQWAGGRVAGRAADSARLLVCRLQGQRLCAASRALPGLSPFIYANRARTVPLVSGATPVALTVRSQA